MINNRKNIVFIMIIINIFIIRSIIADNLCKGNFINIIDNICWECLFPITIGNMQVASGSLPDTNNPSSPICLCEKEIGWQIGMTLGYWEPYALVDVTPQPYCLVNMGGVSLDMNNVEHGGRETPTVEQNGSFYYVHWYKYPLIYWLQIITSTACMQTAEFDLAYLSELDPTWEDDELAFLVNPEASVFANSIAQMACAADATATVAGKPIDQLFWCAGSQGSMYPLTGHVAEQVSPLQGATLLAERADFKLHRLGYIFDSNGDDMHSVCYLQPRLIMPKSRYRYQLINQIADSRHCHPFGQSVSLWEAGHNAINDGDHFGFLIWQKRNCCFL